MIPIPRRYLILILVPITLLVVGTLGYYILEKHYTLFDALYMTVITLTTVGYAEDPPLDTKGRVFTILLLFGGVFSLFYAASEIIRAIVSGELRGEFERRRVQHKLAALNNHQIVCGYGRMGRHICREFSQQARPFVVIDRNAEALRAFDLPHGIPYVGDSTADETLRQAGIERAHALVVVASSDADNLFITLSARLLNPHVFIIARAEGDDAETKLRRAGADRVVSPYASGGLRVVQAVLRPSVVDFLELAMRGEFHDVQIEEISVRAGSRLDQVTLRASRLGQDYNIIIVSIKKTSGQTIFNPSGDALIEAGDTLIALGHRQQLDRLEAWATVG